jgi:hypothetical protein
MHYSTITTEYWFVNKDNGPLIQLKSNTIFNKGSQSKRKNIFIEMIADDAALSEEYKKEDSFSFKSLKYYIHKYNLDMQGTLTTAAK